MRPTGLRPAAAVPQALPTERGSSEAGTVLHPDDWLVQVGWVGGLSDVAVCV